MIKVELLKEFKIRVYGVIEFKGQVLVSEEQYKGVYFCKLPGGGMELGESSIDCLHRELREELQIEILQAELFYACDLVVQNQFDMAQQVMGLYYKVSLDANALKTINANLAKRFIFGSLVHARRFWQPLNNLTQILSFEMDKKALDTYLIKQSPSK